MGMSMSMSMSMTMLISIASFFLLCTSSSSSFLFGEALQQTTCRRILTQAPVPLLASLPATSSRRTWFETIATTTLSGVAVLVTIPSAAASHAGAATYPPTITTDAASLIQSIQDAQTTLGLLLDNWERATTQCNYADVPRDLLSADNKQQLLEKASTFALFDKSVSIESCKTTNRLVRDYIGVTGKGPLVGIEKKIKQALELVDDPEQLDAFVVESESLSRSLARAASLSYTSGTADFDSMNNFAKGDTNRKSDSNLEQAKRAIQEAKDSLDLIVALISVSS